MRWQYSATVSRTSPGDLAQMSGLGFLFHSLIHLRMSFWSSATLRWADRRSLRLWGSITGSGLDGLPGWDHR